MLLSAALLAAATAAAPPRSCRCRVSGHGLHEHATGVGGSVQLAWQLSHPARNATQRAFEVEIAGTHGSDLRWRSGRVASAEQRLDTAELAASAAGALRLPPGASFRWSVRATVAAADGTPSTLSCDGSFETAPAAAAFPGGAKWIGGGGQIHATHGLALPPGRTVQHARAYVSGMGAFYLFLNGQQVGQNIMDPPQSVYSKRVLYATFDIASLLKPGENSVDALLGNYKWGYTDIWCNMTRAGGPSGCRALILRIEVTMSDGSMHSLDTSNPADWSVSAGPVAWDHFFHGETFSGLVDVAHPPAGQPAREMSPPAGAPPGMAVTDPDGQSVTLGALAPIVGPPLRVVEEYPTVSVHEVHANDVASAGWVFDFGVNFAGMSRLSLPPDHGIPPGTELRIEQAEIVAGPFSDTGGMCKLCPNCGACAPPDLLRAQGNSNCAQANAAEGAVCDTYCRTTVHAGLKPLRHEPCFPHQTLKGEQGHETADRYIGDFNAANQTNIYIVGNGSKAETYTPRFAGGGMRFAMLTGVPEGIKPTMSWMTGLKINSHVASASGLKLPVVSGRGSGTPDVLNRIHQMTLASHTSNLWSIPTDCPQRERRGWTGDAQTTSDSAMMNLDMQGFYTKFLDDIRDDQLRYNANHRNDTGAIADVVPYDGVGGNPGCPVWQVVYVVIARNLFKHYGKEVLHVVRQHYEGLNELMAWFARHADPGDGLMPPKTCTEQACGACYGDWMGFDPESRNSGSSSLTPQSSVTSFVHVLALDYMATIASALSEASDASKWTQQHRRALKTYHLRYFNATVGGYSPCVGDRPPLAVTSPNPRQPMSNRSCHGTSAAGSQTSNAMALALGAPPTPSIAQMVANNLAADVRAFGNKTTAGITGLAWMLPQLEKYGHGEIALAVLEGDQYPSIGHMAAQGMTTLCENLACTEHDPGGGSLNHIMFGGFDPFLHTAVGGLDSVVSGSTGGWERIIVRVAPAAIATLGGASNQHETRFGAVSISWRYTRGLLTMDLQVPIGSIAEVHSPLAVGGRSLMSVSESTSQLWIAAERERETETETEMETETETETETDSDAQSVEMRDSAVVTVVGSGAWSFVAAYR